MAEKQILLVDDERGLLKLNKKILQMQGFDCVAHASGLQALDAFSANPESFSLLMTDQSMPEITGIELIQKIRAIRLDLPVILSSGFSDVISEQKMLELDINFLSKPFDPGDMTTLVTQLLDIS